MNGDPGPGAAASRVAVIGMAGRFPGARDLEQLWANLRDGVESVRRFSDEELLAAGESSEALRDPEYVLARAVLDGIDEHDVDGMDPEERLFLDAARGALANAGLSGAAHPGSAAVFASSGSGAGTRVLATRVSYELNLGGPSMDVQTACSSALVAIHLAAQSLLAGECDLALAGAAAVSLPQTRGYLHEAGLTSPDSRCRAFDARADGMVPGGGAGCVVLKRLDDALADGDPVLAVILGSAVNNDGASKLGYLAPSVEGQARVVAEAIAVAGVAPETISYVEAHGSGTLIGDAIEVAALAHAYGAGADASWRCAIGSVKPNIGHLYEASGAASFIKAVLAIERGEIPPSIHCETPSHEIARTPFVVNTTLRAWTIEDGVRRAGVTALGAGGTNAHVILEEAPPVAPSRRRRAPIEPARAAAPAEPERVEPRDEIERELAALWSEILGVASLGVHDDFFDLGGRSLAAVQLFDEIRRRRGVDLPLSTLFEAPTIARLAKLLRVEPAGEERGAPTRWPSRVAIQPMGTRPPFHCVAGMGGNLVNLRRLALLLGSDQPFIGLQPPGLDGRQERLLHVEDLGAHYVEQILAFQPAGPFLLGGYSGGGIAAFEIACQLTRLGHEVAFLGFIDSFSPSLPRRSYLSRARIHARRAASLGPSYLRDLAGRRLRYEQREARRLATRALGAVFPERYRYDNIGDSWLIAERAYEPGAFHGAATLFRAAEESAISLSTAFEVDELHGWGRFVLGGIDVMICPGNHTTMCEDPHVRRLAAKLRAAIDLAL